MGKVQIDIYKQDRMYEHISLTDLDTIKGLILLRSTLDIYNEYGEDVSKISASNWTHVNQTLISTYASMDVAIDRCQFNQSQTAILKLLQIGFTIEDIGQYLGLETKKIRSAFNSIAKQVQKSTTMQWASNMYLNYIPTEWKECRVCGESWPKTDLFFRADIMGKDGVRNDCRLCESAFRTKSAEYDEKVAIVSRCIE